ncbi:hypothetical protein [Nannocystis sp.]|uniref:hypothetical protein n=1 Tax=Nannocystis sp. TaxID=1962667 RepID=UPI0025E4886B|nr:hypothetical protein [Nannocystis sp.]MBK7830366.1 hypothetical protein [Nannocystis sp.]
MPRRLVLVDAGVELDLATEADRDDALVVDAQLLDLVEETEADAAAAQDLVERGEHGLAEVCLRRVVEGALVREQDPQQQAQAGARGQGGALAIAGAVGQQHVVEAGDHRRLERAGLCSAPTTSG